MAVALSTSPLVTATLAPNRRPPRTPAGTYAGPGTLNSRRANADPAWVPGVSPTALTLPAKLSIDQRPITGPMAVATTLRTRRPRPSQNQFDGYVMIGSPAVPASRVVELRWRDGTLIDTTRSNPTTGYFEFIGWYTIHTEYQFVVIGENGEVNRCYPTKPPVTLRWTGNPRAVSSVV